MPRSRLHTPSTDKDGNWYKMGGMCGQGPQYRWETVSGQLLTDVNKVHPGGQNNRPNTVPTNSTTATATSDNTPPGFSKRYTSNYATSNNFSTHDNRNRTQDYGHYFGGGLGRKLFPSIDAHQSQTDPAYWYSTPAGRRESVDTTHRRSYRGAARGHQVKASSSSPCDPSSRPWTTTNANTAAGVITQHNKDPNRINRRFPRNHQVPPEGLRSLDTHVAYPNEPHKTFLQTLCSTQEPFQKHNSWKFSYFGLKI